MSFRAAFALFFLLPAACQAQNEPPRTASGLAVVPLSIMAASGKELRFSVEVAASATEQARGLMFRDQLPQTLE